MNITERKALDKFYTKPEIASLVWEDFKLILSNNNLLHVTVVEPSAGDGKLLDVIDIDKIGFDLVPESENILQNDFLSGDINVPNEMVFFGNPPFGKKGKLAIDFVNKAFTYGKYVGFIVPIQFKKYSVQNRIIKEANLIFERELPIDAFTLGDKDYKVRCVFQVWTINHSEINLRESKPVTTHKDFQMYQYNCTQMAEKYFDYDWDFCVLRQGYGDFNEKFTKEDALNLSRKKQWIFFKANNEEVLSNLLSMDFNKLSELNTSTKGFGKYDVIKQYKKDYEIGTI
jgi:hypothetical protein